MILIQHVLTLHGKSIVIYGGSLGLRDAGLLESTIALPFKSFGGDDLYTSPYGKAAALIGSLIINHPFYMAIKPAFWQWHPSWWKKKLF